MSEFRTQRSVKIEKVAVKGIGFLSMTVLIKAERVAWIKGSDRFGDQFALQKRRSAVRKLANLIKRAKRKRGVNGHEVVENVTKDEPARCGWLVKRSIPDWQCRHLTHPPR